MSMLSSYASRTFASLSVRNYRIYFAGQALSMSGTWMHRVALGWLAYSLSGSGSTLGLVLAAQFAPMLFLGPWGGVIVDRLDKRTTLIWTQTLFAVLVGSLAILVYTGHIEVWMLYVFSLVFGLVSVIENPARQSFPSELVGNDYLKNAVSLNATLNNLARAVGPMLAGIIIATLSIALCFFINAISYLATIAALLLVRSEELHKSAPSLKAPGQLMAGLRYAWSVPSIRITLLMMAVIGTLAYEFQVSLPLFAEQIFAAGAGGYAALMSAFGAGSIVGGLFAAGRHSVAQHQLVVFALLFGGAMVLASVVPSLALAIVGIFVVGVFSINLLSLGSTVVQLESVPEMRGRVMALWSTAMIGSTFIGGPLIGWIGEYAGARWGLAVGGISTLATAAIAGAYLMKRDRYERVPEEVQMRAEQATGQQIRLK
jgi:MFS family permease